MRAEHSTQGVANFFGPSTALLYGVIRATQVKVGCIRAVGLRNEMYGILVVSLGEFVKKPFKHGGKRRSGEMSRDPTVMPK
jgi:hypothetical protein